MTETWKPVLGYEGRYEVSDQGQVKSILAGKVLAPNKMNHGYTCVHLYTNGRSTRQVKTIHQLVAAAFLPNPEQYREVNHKNFIRHDNRVENLEWVSRKQNVRHALAAGRRVKPEKRVKGIHLATGRIVGFESQVAAEEELRGTRTGAISHAMKNNRPAYGFVWWFE